MYIIEKLNFVNLGWKLGTPLIFMLGDLITGYIQAVINKKVDSQKMRIGLLHKSLLLIIIILGFIFDLAFSMKSLVSNVVCTFIVIMEVVSIAENLKKAGLNLGYLGKILKTKTEETTNESLSKLVDTIDKAVNEEEKNENK